MSKALEQRPQLVEALPRRLRILRVKVEIAVLVFHCDPAMVDGRHVGLPIHPQLHVSLLGSETIDYLVIFGSIGAAEKRETSGTMRYIVKVHRSLFDMNDGSVTRNHFARDSIHRLEERLCLCRKERLSDSAVEQAIAKEGAGR